MDTVVIEGRFSLGGLLCHGLQAAPVPGIPPFHQVQSCFGQRFRIWGIGAVAGWWASGYRGKP